MTVTQLRKIWLRTNGHCHFCGDPVEFDKRGWNQDLTGYWEVDHIIQKYKGGTPRVENCLPACTRCNRLRWHRDGERIRELLLLGLIARDQIKKKSKLGKELVDLRAKRLEENKKRRSQS